MSLRHNATPRRIMTTAEVAEYLQVHPTTLYRLVRKGQIPGFKIGSNYRFDRDEIDKWIKKIQRRVRHSAVTSAKLRHS